MTTLREAAAQALDALTKIHPGNMSWETGDAWMDAVQILRDALAQPEPKPLTDEEIFGLYESTSFDWVQGKSSKGIEVLFARAIERAHGIGEKE